jgi:hypothetical protein
VGDSLRRKFGREISKNEAVDTELGTPPKCAAGRGVSAVILERGKEKCP